MDIIHINLYSRPIQHRAPIKDVSPVHTIISPYPLPYAPRACPCQLSTLISISLKGPLATFPTPRPNAIAENMIVVSADESTFWTSRIIADQIAEKLPANIPYATQNTSRTGIFVENPQSRKTERTVPMVDIETQVKASQRSDKNPIEMLPNIDAIFNTVTVSEDRNFENPIYRAKDGR